MQARNSRIRPGQHGAKHRSKLACCVDHIHEAPATVILGDFEPRTALQRASKGLRSPQDFLLTASIHAREISSFSAVVASAAAFKE